MGVRVEDRTEQFIECLNRELDRVKSGREDFIKVCCSSLTNTDIISFL